MTRILSALAATFFLMIALAAPASAEEVELVAPLSGANEVGDAGGDLDGFGQATISIDDATGEVCFNITTSGTEAPAAAHIHSGAARSNGDVVVDFDWATNGGSGCVTAPGPTLVAIATNPSLYYVNVHTPDYPAGSVRGQLAVASAATAPVEDADELAFTGSSLTPLLAVAGAAMIGGGTLITRAARRREQ